MVNLCVGNTDGEWFDFLLAQPQLHEANFWRPSPQPFRAIGSGELFAFRLKNPRNRIGGFGVLSDSTVLPLQVAWETFGIANGAPDFEALCRLIAKLRPDEVVGPATNIGCRVLVETVFLRPEQWFELPATWAPNIVSGKGFSTDDPDGLALWQRLQNAASSPPQELVSGFAEASPRFGEPRLIPPRLGQGAFRVAVTEAYERRCALTDGKVLPALDAAHIVPYGEGARSRGVAIVERERGAWRPFASSRLEARNPPAGESRPLTPKCAV